MALKINKISETSHSVELGETLWLTDDRSEVVADGDPRAAFLLGTAGKRVTVEEAERLGLVKKGAKAKEASPEADKSAVPKADKEAKPEAVKDIVARIADMSDDELAELEADERKGVQDALEAERGKRAEEASDS